MIIFIKKHLSDNVALPLFEKKKINKGLKINLGHLKGFSGIHIKEPLTFLRHFFLLFDAH